MGKSGKTKPGTAPSAKEHTCMSEENLRRLEDTCILEDFVIENSGSWDHQKWLDLCEKIRQKGFSPIDFDQVGLMLEKIKADFMSAKR